MPIEIKGIKNKEPKLMRSFISFKERYNPKKAYFITNGYYGKDIFKHTRIYFLPSYLTVFLKEL